jgi:hypothetical protein
MNKPKLVNVSIHLIGGPLDGKRIQTELSEKMLVPETDCDLSGERYRIQDSFVLRTYPDFDAEGSVLPLKAKYVGKTPIILNVPTLFTPPGAKE